MTYSNNCQVAICKELVQARLKAKILNIKIFDSVYWPQNSANYSIKYSMWNDCFVY